ncbi:hypothetical protein PV325_006169 [Microctonus aethiopoides]|uniref:tRNA (adenine(58)-N(1))-methyltransferase non-catalytic subunit TRM6 n=1 Tax=Microctonus aethiopoides TaxID=144406 RepID=A0AA39FUN1_9HYME|nr:hypothetical protein PV325_006169 [Microctonus aethiopoides]KAK0097993.1 hypothetical protein PV326_012014 [Microctonus aethiopoides]KAK0175926.1 hypothetical protein PV328_000115 [Microctonus aethiopoides]
MEEQIEQEIVRPGSYVVVQKQNFRKLCKVSEKGTFTLGKEQIEMEQLIGKCYWSTFKMIPSKNGKKNITLILAEKAETSEELRKGVTSGIDNRSITDDGTSQKLSREEIEDLREAGKSSNEIVGCLIENSTSFASKTEYSQEKYIKKKENKYFRYLTILKPSIAILQAIYFRQDHSKINCLRMDTLSQILSFCDVKADGQYILYDGGSCGLAAAALMSRIGSETKGNLIHLHPGNQAQMTLVHAMNFPDEQLKRMHTVNLYTFLRLYHQGENVIIDELAKKYALSRKLANDVKRKNNDEDENNLNIKRPKFEDSSMKADELIVHEDNKIDDTTSLVGTFKMPRWFDETREAVNRIKQSVTQGLAIIGREHPLNIINELLSFLGASRPFVIYHCHREPLQETYVALKQRKDIINLKLFSNFCRGYQVLHNRTHPDIMTNDLGGYLLTGYLVI